MAIARLLKTEIVCMAGDDARLIEELERERIIQLDDVHDGLADEYAEMESSPFIDASRDDAEMQKAKGVLDAFTKYSPVKKGLLENFFGSPPYVGEEAFRDIAASVDIEEYEARVQRITSEIDALSRSIEKLDETRDALLPWSFFEGRLSDISSLKRVVPMPLILSTSQAPAAVESFAAAVASADAVWTELHAAEKRVFGVLFAVPEAAAEIQQKLKTLGIDPVRLPDLDESPRQALERIAREREGLSAKKDGLIELILKHAGEGRRHVQAVSDDRSNAREKKLLRRKLFYTRNVVAVRGWILERDRPKLETLLRGEFPDSEARFAAPEPKDNPPVKLENPGFLRPFQGLLEMFGLPTYFGIDPTWFVAIAMNLYYAICLGDAGYGACQIFITWWLNRKFKPAEGTRLFLKMFQIMGYFTVIFGVLTWSIFGFSPGYTVGGPKILGFLPLFVPANDILLIIGISAAIGAVFQLSSILLSFFASLKSGDRVGAYLDRLAWFVMLTSGIVMLGSKVLGLPQAVFYVSLSLVGAGVVSIFLFSGRDSKSIVGRLFTGLISFYGILGYYGVVSFLGDVLSYLRLAVLNLTGSFIGFVANLIGGLIMGGGGGAIILTVIMTVIGIIPVLFFHVLNLVLSMQGSFIHSLRLNYLESFSRYYGSGGKAFSPLKKEGRYYRFEQ